MNVRSQIRRKHSSFSANSLSILIIYINSMFTLLRVQMSRVCTSDLPETNVQPSHVQNCRYRAERQFLLERPVFCHRTSFFIVYCCLYYLCFFLCLNCRVVTVKVTIRQFLHPPQQPPASQKMISCLCYQSISAASTQITLKERGVLLLSDSWPTR